MRPTGDLSPAAGAAAAALISQGRNLSLQHLQAAHEFLQAGQVLAAATCPPGNVDAVGEDDLVLPVHRVLGGVLVRRDARVPGS